MGIIVSNIICVTMSRLILVMITGMIGPNVSWFVTGGFHWRITYNYASHWPPSHHCVWVSLWCDCVMSWYWPGWLLLRPLCGLAQSELLLPCRLLLQNSSSFVIIYTLQTPSGGRVARLQWLMITGVAPPPIWKRGCSVLYGLCTGPGAGAC